MTKASALTVDNKALDRIEWAFYWVTLLVAKYERKQDALQTLIELGRRRIVGDQEDMIVDVALDLKNG